MSTPTAEQLVSAQGTAQAALAVQAIAQVRARIQTFTAWYDDQQVQALMTQVAAAVQAIQRVTASTNDAYLARITSLIKGRIVRPAGAVDTSTLRTGVQLEDVYNRLAVNYRYLVSTKQPPDKALKLVVNRGTAMATTDVQLAARAQWQQFFRSNGVSSYRRVIHPELSKGGTCGLCIAASDRIYHVDQLLPIHDGCHCGVMPIIGGVDVGLRLNQADLKRLYAEAGSTGAADLKRVQWVIHQHGELGPVLGRKGQKFRSANHLPAAA